MEMDERRLSVEPSMSLRDNPTFWSTPVGLPELQLALPVDLAPLAEHLDELCEPLCAGVGLPRRHQTMQDGITVLRIEGLEEALGGG